MRIKKSWDTNIKQKARRTAGFHHITWPYIPEDKLEAKPGF
jgi:hypothetical protein